MRPIIAAAKAERKRIIYAEGEDERVLRAAQIILEEGMAAPILIGRPQVVEPRRALRPEDPARGATSSSSTRRTIRATATMSTTISRSSAAAA